MASTYSTNLKIELITSGEQNNSWGNTTNDNFSDVFEQAIVGFGNPSFTSDANLTLTLVDSVSAQTARCFVLRLTSTVSLTATRNLIVPTIQKPYVIFNNTTGGQSIIVKTAAGTGITVPNGKKMFLYTNGTDVVDIIDNFSALTVNNDTVATLTATQSLTNKAIATLGPVTQNVTAVAATAINCSLGNYFTKTITVTTNWTFTNVPSTAFGFILVLTNGGSQAVTWPAAVKWPNAVIPTLTVSGVDVLTFLTDDGGTTWRGVMSMQNSS
jgi:hypothetical protein